jgi:hypothetical protein
VDWLPSLISLSFWVELVSVFALTENNTMGDKHRTHLHPPQPLDHKMTYTPFLTNTNNLSTRNKGQQEGDPRATAIAQRWPSSSESSSHIGSKAVRDTLVPMFHVNLITILPTQ